MSSAAEILHGVTSSDAEILHAVTSSAAVLLGLGQRRRYGGNEDFSSSSSVTMSPFRKTYNPRKFS